MPSLSHLFPTRRKIAIGMVHLLPLPGSPQYAGSMTKIRDAALRDTEALSSGGIDGIMIENFGDIPFFPARVPAETVAAITTLAAEVRRAAPKIPLGINVLRNDGQTAIAIAAAIGANFVRINVLCGARVCDQGLLQGIAHDVLRLRTALHAQDIAIFADVDVKHSAPLAARPLEDEVDDTLHRGQADALIVSGAGTGKATDISKTARIKSAAGKAPVFIGSGASAKTIPDFGDAADGFIVGTSLKKNGNVANPVDLKRVKDLMRVMHNTKVSG